MISKSVIVSGALVALSVSAAAQQGAERCVANVREISGRTPRMELMDLVTPVSRTSDIIADAASCVRVRTGPAITRFVGSVPVRVSWQPWIARVNSLSGLPDTRFNDGAWSGRGINYYLRAGIGFDAGFFHATVAPSLSHTANEQFDFFPSPNGARSAFASHLYDSVFSIDLPSRFGADPVTRLDPGETAAWLSWRMIDVGAGTSHQAWGPGLHGNLILGSDAPGIPRGFIRTSRPVDTRIGSISGTAFLGTLTESRFFDLDTTNDFRTIGAWTVAWSPSSTSGVSLGWQHATMREGSRYAGHTAPHGPSEQMNGAFLRYFDPTSGMRAWVEVARQGKISSGREFLTMPYKAITYIAGAERAVRTSYGTWLLSGEVANLEQPEDVRLEPTQDFYTSRVIPQGWTQRGMLLGYGTGPGSNAQFIATDWMSARYSAGLFVERVRWNEDAFLRQFLAFPNRHDVQARLGARFGANFYGYETAFEISNGRRINYLFQNTNFILGYRTVDVKIPQLRITVTTPRR